MKDEEERDHEPTEQARSLLRDASHSARSYLSEVSENGVQNHEHLAAPKQTNYLPPSHPATAMHEVLETFGPLIFPLHRAAILRKRILFLCSPPLKRICNLGKRIYNLHTLSV